MKTLFLILLLSFSLLIVVSLINSVIYSFCLGDFPRFKSAFKILTVLSLILLILNLIFAVLKIK